MNTENRDLAPLRDVTQHAINKFFVLEFNLPEFMGNCLILDGTKYKEFYTLRVMKVKKLVDHWNKEVDKIKNLKTNSLGVAKEEEQKDEYPTEDKLYIGNLPLNLPESEVRKIVGAFGTLKSFNLVRDPLKPDISRGYAFFEYREEKSAEKAIRALNNMDFKDKKLRVQRSAVEYKPG